MVALPVNDLSSGAASAGWQSIRQQLFGEQRQREAEDRFIAILTQVQTQIAVARGGPAGHAPQAPRVRAAILRTIVDGANSLLLWQREEARAAQAAGWRHTPASDAARQILDRVREACPLFESARAVSGTVDCADVVDSIAQLRGAESDAFFVQVLRGTTLLLKGAFAWLESDASTAAAAASLRPTWLELAAEVEALTPSSAAKEAAAAPAAAPIPVALAGSMPAPLSAARFSRFRLVAC